MAALTEIYVDPAIAGNSGAGTIGDPYGDLQYALDTVTRDATNGNRINIKAGTSEILAAQLSIATYGNPTQDAPLHFRGYTSASGDGGMGAISAGGGVFVMNPVYFFIHWENIRFHNASPTTYAVQLQQLNTFVSCKVDDITSPGTAAVAANISPIISCELSDISGIGLLLNAAGATVFDCYFRDGASKKFTRALDSGLSSYGAVTNCIFSLTGSGTALYYRSLNAVTNCTFYGNTSSTGRMIDLDGGPCTDRIVNCYFGDASGTGAIAIFGINTAINTAFYRSNAFYNNTTNESGWGDIDDGLDNEYSLASSGIAKSGADTFANRLTYYAPLDVGNMYAGWPAAPYFKGAVPPTAGGGGDAGMLRRSSMRGGY